MKTAVNLLILSVIFGFISCGERFFGGGGLDLLVYASIIGDTGRTVQISYLEREKVKNTTNDHSVDGSPAPEYIYGNSNVTVSESVTLPFFKEIHYTNKGVTSGRDVFLEVVSENDSTTKAVIFELDFFVSRPDGNKCYSVVGILTGNTNYGMEDCAECTTCKGLTSDSIWNSLKISNYSGYMEFSKDDVTKKVNFYDKWGY
ncbi:MAG: hypothetical protein LBS55_11105 [Prevotellaceae bacterium]|jgi:hypothetical protein|nr:hypothetical protein [Prevotellaceae bacterium]